MTGPVVAIVGVLAAAGAAAGAHAAGAHAAEPGTRELALRAYLVGYEFWLGIAGGSLAIGMLHGLSGGGWGEAIRAPLRAALLTIPLLAVLFIPIVIGLGDLYVWARPEAVAADLHLQHKAAYLNRPFFIVRALVCFAVWIGLAFALRASDEDRAEKLGGPGLVLFGLTMTFATVDWVMSLDPMWFSTLFALHIMVGQVLSAFAFLIAVIGLSPGRVEVGRLHDLGNLLFAFVMIWAYLGISQFLIIWSANLPEEIPWYLRRFDGGYAKIAVALVVLHWAVPFVLLLSRSVKRNPKKLAGVAILVLVMRYVDLWWQIVPELAGAGRGLPGFMDIAIPVAIGVVWLGAFRMGVRRARA